MRKFVALFIAAVLAVSLCACDKEETKEDSKDAVTEASAEVEVSADGLSEEGTESSEEVEEPTASEGSAEADGENKLPSIKDLENIGNYIELGTWKGVNVAEKSEVTEELIKQITEEEFLSDKATQEEKKTAAELGDTVIIDYKGFYEDTGEAFSGGEAKGAELLLGSGKFVPGFEEGVVGHYPGESFDIYLTFPEDYHEDLAGKRVRFAIVLSKITRTVYPEVDADLAKELGFDSVEDFDKAVLDIAEEMVYTENLGAVWSAVLEGAVVKEYPKEHFDSYAEDFKSYYLDQYNYYATIYGMELGEYMENMYGMTEEEFLADLDKNGKSYAEGALKEEMTLYAVADAAFNRQVSDGEYKEMLAGYAEDQKTTPEELEKEYGKEYLLENMLWDKVMVYLYDNAVFGAVTE